MKKNVLVLFISAVMLQGCKEAAIDKETEPVVLDSFKVSGIDIGQQVQDFHYINSKTLCSYNLIYKELVYFDKGADGIYHAAAHKPIETEAWGSLFIGDDHLNYFLSRSNLLSVYDSAATKKVGEQPIKHVFKYLTDSFSIFSPHSAPVIKCHDTLVTSLSHAYLQSYRQYFKEPEITEFKLNKDSITFLRSYMVKPKNLSNYCFPFSRYCTDHNTLFLVYPCFDTLYTYNRTNNTSGKTPIHNKDYQLPENFDMSKVWTPDYGSYQTTYSLGAFTYSAIYYNELTKHFILFYTAPVAKKIKDRMATPDDQYLKAIVLNEDLKAVNYYSFKNRHFVVPESFFFVPGKGLAMPVFKGIDNYETTTFYIYNL